MSHIILNVFMLSRTPEAKRAPFPRSEHDNLELSLENERLKRELETLNRQLASTIPINSQIEETYNENIQLQKTICELEAEKDDYHRRLQLSIQRIDELQAEAEACAKKRQIDAVLEADEIRERIASSESLHAREMAIAKDALAKSETKFSDLEMQLKEFRTERLEIFGAASQHFGTDVGDDESLMRLLLIPPPPVVEMCREIDNSPPPKRRKRKAVEQKVIREPDFRMSVVVESLEQTVREKTLEMDEMRNRVEMVEGLNGRLTAENLKLQEAVAAMKAEVEYGRVEQKSEHLNAMIEVSTKLKSVTAQLQDAERQKETLKKQLKPLLTKGRELESAKSRLSNEVDDLRVKLIRIESERDRLAEDYKALSEEYTQITEANKESENAFANADSEVKELRKRIRLQESDLDNLRLSVAELGRACKDEKDAGCRYKQQADSLSDIVEATTAQCSKLQTQLSAEVRARETLEAGSKRLQKKLLQSREPAEIDSLFGLAAFAVDEFPKELADIIHQISSNPTLKTPSKLRHIFAAVAEYFRAANVRTTSELDSLKEIKEYQTDVKSRLRSIICKIVPEGACDVQDLIDDSASQEALSRIIGTLRTDRMTLINEKERLESEFTDLLVALDVDDVQSGKEKIMRLENELERVLVELDSASSKSAEIASHIKSRSNAKVAKAETTMQALLEQIDYLKVRLGECQGSKDEECDRLERSRSELEDVNVELRAKIETLESTVGRFVADITAQKKKSCELAERNELLVKRTERDARTISLHVSQKREMKERLESLRTAARQTSSDEAGIRRSAMDNVTRQCGRQVHVLTDRLKEYESTIQRLTKELSDADNAVLATRERTLDLEQRLHKSELTIDLMKREHERAKLLLEGNIRHQKIKHANSVKEYCGAIDGKLREARRDVMTIVAMHFASIIDSDFELNDETFGAVLEHLRIRIMDLIGAEMRIRRLLSIGPLQSIETEISRLMLSQKK